METKRTLTIKFNAEDVFEFKNEPGFIQAAQLRADMHGLVLRSIYGPMGDPAAHDPSILEVFSASKILSDGTVKANIGLDDTAVKYIMENTNHLGSSPLASRLRFLIAAGLEGVTKGKPHVRAQMDVFEYN